MRAVKDAPSGPSVDRLLALSDGVVAIALTLLVLQLAVPQLSDPRSASQLAHALNQMGGRAFTYLIAFLVIGQFWLAHHRVFRMIAGHHESVAWANFAFLFTITLLPFTSNLVGRYGENPVAVDVFAANMLLASLTTTFAVDMARSRDLLAPGTTSAMMRVGKLRTLGMVIVLVPSMAVAWVSTGAAKYMWLLLILVPSAVSRFYLGDARQVRRREG